MRTHGTHMARAGRSDEWEPQGRAAQRCNNCNAADALQRSTTTDCNAWVAGGYASVTEGTRHRGCLRHRLGHDLHDIRSPTRRLPCSLQSGFAYSSSAVLNSSKHALLSLRSTTTDGPHCRAIACMGAMSRMNDLVLCWHATCCTVLQRLQQSVSPCQAGPAAVSELAL